MEADDEIRRAVDAILGGDRKYTYSELAERSGMDADALRTARSAFGLPRVDDDERRWDDRDIEVAEGLKTLLDAGVPVERVLELNRVVGRAMLQVAAAARAIGAELLTQQSPSEDEVAAVAAELTAQLAPRMAPTLAYVFEAHLRELLSSDVISAADIAAGRTPGARDVAVAFADLVGFTRMGEEVPAEEVGEVVRRLEALAADLVEPPVTFVKSIGDAVMLVAPAVAPLLETGTRLVEASAGHDLRLRVGVACGAALERAADWYGSPVNQASRVTAVARPGSVLATAAAHDQVGDDDGWSWSFAGERRLKGVGDVKLFRARRPETKD